jgi:hypothetical protein
MLCTNCETSVEERDNFCRHCGAPLTGAMLPVPAVSNYPITPWRNVAGTVARGMAAVAVSAALEITARALVKKALRLPASTFGSKGITAGRSKAFPTEIVESRMVLIRRIKAR